MIARHESTLKDKADIWSALAAPLPAHAIEWRQDGKAMARDGKFFARFVPYVTAQYVAERLDSIVPGEWDSTLEPLAPRTRSDRDGVDLGDVHAFKCRIQVLGVIREDVGEGEDYKGAATDAFKRAAVRFGIARQLYSSEPNWVPVESDSKFAKPVMDPTEVYTKRYGALPGVTASAAPARVNSTGPQLSRGEVEAALDMEPVRGSERAAPSGAETMRETEERACPKCGGRTWDNRVGKRNPKAPDFKCRDRGCDGVIWPPKGDKGREVASVVESARSSMTGEQPPHPAEDPEGFPAALVDEADDLPF